MKIKDFDYELPKELIAQRPVEPRDSSRLMVVDRQTGSINHHIFKELPEILTKNDVLVFNQSKVFPARLYGFKDSGGKTELLLIRKRSDGSWEAITKPGLKTGQKVKVKDLEFKVIEVDSEGITRGLFNYENDELTTKIEEYGYTPLPPYIHSHRQGEDANIIRRLYQTVYAKETGSAAAPTAGFHFTKELLERLKAKGVGMEFVTLHVGLGTFKPVKSSNIEDHKMHSEQYFMGTETANRILNYKKEGRRIISVGTTANRVLETWISTGRLAGETDIFIYPGYKFKMTEAMITNFHLPKSTLIMLVTALAGRDLIMRAYEEAIANKYRFFSFGDAMLIV